MQVANYSEFRKNMKQYLDRVVDENNELIIHRQGGKSVVVLSVEEYNALDETGYLTGSKANKGRLDAAIASMQRNEGVQRQLMENDEAL